MDFITNHLDIGLKSPLRLLHTSDIHLCYADERDNSRKNALAQSRKNDFDGNSNHSLDTLHQALDYAAKNCDLLVDTGDIIDFVSELNLDIVRASFKPEYSFIAAGNHEFSQYVGEAWEDHQYKMQSFAHVQAAYPNPLRSASRQLGGVNLVALDNTYYYFEEEHVDFLKQEIARGLPIILMFHNPIYTQELGDFAMNTMKHPCTYTIGAPDDIVNAYQSPYRTRQQKTNSVTRDFIDFLKDCPSVKAILSGHLHFNFETTLFGRIPQFVTGRHTGRILEIS